MTGKQPFETVVARHGRTVLRLCRASLSRTDADDAWSETFLAALKAYPQLPDDANVEAWLVTIAHRKVIDLARATARRAVPVGAQPHRATRQELATPPASWQLDSSDPALVELVSRLPERQRYALAYHHFAGLPYAQVAEILGGTAVAARRAAADGIAALRRAYSETRQLEGERS